MRPRPPILGLLGGLLLGLLPACRGPEPAHRIPPVSRGPLPMRTQQAAAQGVFHFIPRSARVQKPGDRRFAARVAYSSISEIAGPPDERVAFDGEILRATAGARFGLRGEGDLEVEVPVLYTTSGFLDAFVDDFHEFFSLPAGGRDDRADDQWEMRMTRNGDEVFDIHEDELVLGDIPIVYTERITDELDAPYSLAWQLAFELPTGSEGSGLGNGKLDFGAGLIAEKTFGRWTATAGTHFVQAGTPSDLERAGVEWNELIDGQLGLECRWSQNLSLIGGLVWRSALTSDYTYEEIDRELLDLGVGFALGTGRYSSLTVSFHEDLIAASGPDFSVLVGWTCGF